MHLRSRQWNFYLSVLGAVAALMFSGTFAHAQLLYQLDWGEIFNNSANTDTEDDWVANSYTILKGGEQIVGITLPIGGQTTDVFTNQPISALIYQGFDINDPTANGGLVLMQETDTTFSTTGPSVVTITLDTPVTFSVGDIMYAAVLIPAVPATIFPFNLDVGTGSGLGGLLQTQPLEQSFFDVGLTFGGPYNVNQGSANITVLGGTHPVVGVAQDPGNLALWVNAIPAP